MNNSSHACFLLISYYPLRLVWLVSTSVFFGDEIRDEEHLCALMIDRESVLVFEYTTLFSGLDI